MIRPTLVALSLALAAAMAAAEDYGALLDLLVRKKLITAEEAAGVQAELAKEKAAAAAGKIALAAPLTELKLGGDLRLRYQYDNRDLQVSKARDDKSYANDNQRSRFRFRLRLNGDFRLTQNFFGGVQLVTGQPSDSDNQTFQDGFSDYSIYIGRAFMGWGPNDWFTAVGGKMANPIYSTELVWDSDISPTGFSQQLRFDKMFLGGPGRDPARRERRWGLALNLSEFIYDDNTESSADGDLNTDAWILGAQLVGGYQCGKDVKVTFAPGILFFNAADLSGFNNENAFSDVPGVSGESRKMTLITAPGDIAFKLGRFPAKIYWDVAYNTQGGGRFDDIYDYYVAGGRNLVERDHAPDNDGTGFRSSHHSARDDLAWLAGFQLGQLKKTGDWLVRVDYRQTGLTAVDPNLNESAFAMGELNTQGFKLGLSYSFGDAVYASASYMYAWNLRKDLEGGWATGGWPANNDGVAGGNVIQVFQLDVNVKF